MSEEPRIMDKADCKGCQDDFYNGNNPYGVSECWMFESATLEPRLLIHVDDRPPYVQEPELRPTCYKRKRFVTVKPEALDEQGFWNR